MRRRRELLSEWPSLLPLLHDWWAASEVDAKDVSFEVLASLLRENDFVGVLDGRVAVPLLELLEEFLQY